MLALSPSTMPCSSSHTSHLPWTVVLTGGMGSGKTTVARYLAERGARVIDADDQVAACLLPGHPCYDAIQRRWPEALATSDAPPSLSKPYLRRRLALNTHDRAWLEQLLHPHVRQRIADARREPTQAPYDVLVIPLWVEHGPDQPKAYTTNRVCTVDCERTTQRERALARDPSLTPEVLHALLQRQASRAERRAAADDVLPNDGSLEELLTGAAALHATWCSLAQASSANSPSPTNQQPPQSCAKM